MTSLNRAVRPAQNAAPEQGDVPTLGYLAYGIGMVGERVFRDAPALLLLLFMINFLAIPAGLAGLAIFIPKIAVIVMDPLVGSFSDRLTTRWGRRRPLMLIGAVLSSLAMVAFFRIPNLTTPAMRALYMGAMITIGFGAYSLFSVPYLTMAAEIVSTARQRSKMMSYRVVFMAIGLTIGSFAGGVIDLGGGGLGGYRFMSWLFAAICLTTMLTTVFGTGFARNAERPSEPMIIFDQVRFVFSNKRYRLLWSVGFMQKLGEGVGYGSFAFFCIYVVRQPLSSISLVVVSAMTAQALSQPFWLWAAKRWSSTTVYTWGVLGWCLNLAAWPLMKGQSQFWLIPLGLQAGISSGGFLMITLSQLSNLIAHESARTGRNQEGTFSGFWLAGEKVAFALGALIVGLMLQAFGFVEGGTSIPQSSTATLGIALTYCGINGLIYLSSIVLMRRYSSHETATS